MVTILPLEPKVLFETVYQLTFFMYTLPTHKKYLSALIFAILVVEVADFKIS